MCTMHNTGGTEQHVQKMNMPSYITKIIRHQADSKGPQHDWQLSLFKSNHTKLLCEHTAQVQYTACGTVLAVSSEKTNSKPSRAEPLTVTPEAAERGFSVLLGEAQ